MRAYLSNANTAQKQVPAEQQYTILDTAPLQVAPKLLPPEDQQAPNESLTLWGNVTKAIHAKQFSKATGIKQELEEAQRVKARERERTGVVYYPVFFSHAVGNEGQPELTDKGRQLLERSQKGEWSLEGIE